MQRTEANLEDHGRSKEQIDRLQAKAGEINGNSPCALGNGGGATPPAGLLITKKSSVRFVPGKVFHRNNIKRRQYTLTGTRLKF